MERVELEIAVDAGLSIAQLAERFGRSKGSVRYWLSKYELKTLNRSGRESSPGVLAARAAGRNRRSTSARFTAQQSSCWTRRVTFAVGRVAVRKRRRRVKQALIQEAGGRCRLCGYDRYQGALAFHHVDPQTKAMTIATGITLAIETLRTETRKVCAALPQLPCRGGGRRDAGLATLRGLSYVTRLIP
jgi:hypothetical protein